MELKSEKKTKQKKLLMSCGQDETWGMTRGAKPAYFYIKIKIEIFSMSLYLFHLRERCVSLYKDM